MKEYGCPEEAEAAYEAQKAEDEEQAWLESESAAAEAEALAREEEESMIEMCIYYTTSGHPNFKPRCKLGLQASLRCHSAKAARMSCPHYIGSNSPEEEKFLRGES